MKKTLLSLLPLILFCTPSQNEASSIPGFLLGSFEDDYEISYTISDSLFAMGDHTRIHIKEWNIQEQYFVGQNDSMNIYDPLLYSRIDWMEFEDMNDFKWGFCMSAYNEAALDSAKLVNKANREVPTTGCGGYPFSRMKRVTNQS
ncbi:MAG: hypothetical protein JJ971_14525 [Balneolaceae bacterium]|nr:hypothetical protein [Balneolaceae bacterium]MBO6547612.1 hypothetical protein [Balneolaceae bacterium]MBO6648123.1 hypothetical protein [Balneolaceae bacterium]